MKTIPIINTKNLGDKFIESLRTELNKFTWLTYSYPATKVGQRENKSKYPQVYMDNGTYEIIDLQPDNSVKAYCFFEKNNYNIANRQTSNLNTYNFSLIFWLNLPAINPAKNYDFSDEVLKDILDVLHDFSVNNISVDFNNPFEKYNIQVTDNQYFMYPFTAFKINFTKQISETC